MMTRRDAAPPRTATRRVAIVAGDGSSIRRTTAGLIAALTSNQHAVSCFAPAYEPHDRDEIEAAGGVLQALPEAPKGFRLFPGRARVTALAAQLSAWAPHAMIAIASPAVAEVLLAAKRARIARSIVLVDDLRPEDGAQLKRALELTDVAVFNNADHPKTLKGHGHLPADLSYTVVPGSGVDLQQFETAPLPPFGSGLVFLMVARRSGIRHVEGFGQAARLVKSRSPASRFLCAFETGATPEGIAAVASYADTVETVAPSADHRTAIAGCHVFVYLSDGEGMPSPVLQALAMGRPVISTDVPGCRDTVDEKVNGCLIPSADPEALAAALQTFLKRPDLIPHLARASRAKAERRFDATSVNAAMIELLRLA
ncbi:MAG: glycosyltransferase [Hyphomicrobiaceae bacterium]|nr:glycosyltransferase [Hyphomicrobiaceae bacterium]